MSEVSPSVGSVAWVDLTVPDAEEIRTFIVSRRLGTGAGRYERIQRLQYARAGNG